MESKTDVESEKNDETSMPMVEPTENREDKSAREKKPPWIKIAIGVVVIVVLVIVGVLVGVLTTGGSSGSNHGLEIIGLTGSEIGFTPGDASSYKAYVDRLNEFIKPYEQAKDGGNVTICDDKPPPSNKVCLFQASWLDTCSTAKEWGFSNSAPCVLVTYHSDETPDVYESVEELPEDMPADLKEVIESEEEFLKIVWVYCTNGIAYAPIQGFSPYYFPSKNVDYYLSPIVAITFDLTRTSEINVECSMWSKTTGKVGLPKFTIRKGGA